MDFGPSHGRLSDIMQKSIYKPTKESKETLPPPPLPPPTKSCLTKPKGRPPSSVDKPKLEKTEVSEPVMERFIIEDAADISPKTVTKKCEGTSCFLFEICFSFYFKPASREFCKECGSSLIFMLQAAN